MPSKSANVKNEKQYEALKDKGMSKQRAADRQLAERLEERRQEVGIGRQLEAGRDHGPAQGCWPQGRQGGGQEVARGRAVLMAARGFRGVSISVVVIASWLGVACGPSSDVSNQVRNAALTFHAAIASGDGGTACVELTDEAVNEVEEIRVVRVRGGDPRFRHRGGFRADAHRRVWTRGAGRPRRRRRVPDADRE